jgi:hypothetical protein
MTELLTQQRSTIQEVLADALILLAVDTDRDDAL